VYDGGDPYYSGSRIFDGGVLNNVLDGGNLLNNGRRTYDGGSVVNTILPIYDGNNFYPTRKVYDSGNI
jgi:hypothetical protein